MLHTQRSSTRSKQKANSVEDIYPSEELDENIMKTMSKF